jgi:hypothetical protein
VCNQNLISALAKLVAVDPVSILNQFVPQETSHVHHLDVQNLAVFSKKVDIFKVIGAELAGAADIQLVQSEVSTFQEVHGAA